MDSRLGLPEDTVLDGSYRIKRVVGSGGFGITYEAEDIKLGTTVALKEYFPFDFGDRDSTMSVRPKSERHSQTFEWGRSNFLQEARTLARFEHPSIVRVTRVFEANSTACMVMRFERGPNFEQWLDELGRPPTQAELDRIAGLLLDALEMMHGANFLHRDIAPDNVIIRPDGSPVLLDFGSARRAVAEMSRTLTGIVKAGYSPNEQYASDSRLQGPWSDLYALGGMFYRAVTGRPPEESTLRVIDDEMRTATQAAVGSYRRGFLEAIDACLRVSPSARPRSVAQLRPMLLGPEAQPLRATGSFPKTIKLSSVRQGLPAVLSAWHQTAAARRWLGVGAAVVIVSGAALAGLARWQPIGRGEVDASVERQAADAEARRKEAKRLADLDAARQLKEEQLRAAAEAEAKRQTAEAEARRKAAEAKRLADIEAEKRAKEVADAEARRQAAEAKRLADIEAEKRAKEEQARASADADAKRQAAEAEARRKAAEAKRLADIEAEKRVKEEQARIAADAEARRKVASRDGEANPRRDSSLGNEAAVTLSAEERAEFVKRVQKVLKASNCYSGPMNGRPEQAQEGVDQFVASASKKGKEKPVRIELAKATVSDLETWLRDADDIKGALCPGATSAKSEKQPERRAKEEPRRQQQGSPRPQQSAPRSSAPIQGIQ